MRLRFSIDVPLDRDWLAHQAVAQGGPHEHIVAALADTLENALADVARWREGVIAMGVTCETLQRITVGR